MYVVFGWTITEFVFENLEDLAASPSLFAVCVVGIVIGDYSSEAEFFVQLVGSGPGIAGCCDDVGRRC
jgi:hypothetical protein